MIDESETAMSGDERSLFEILGIPRESFLPDPPEDVWDAALARALDPDSAPVDDSLVPQMDDTIHIVSGEDGSGLLDDSDNGNDVGGLHPDFGDFDVLGEADDTEEGIAGDIHLGDVSDDLGDGF